jgi:hypothetical protein
VDVLKQLTTDRKVEGAISEWHPAGVGLDQVHCKPTRVAEMEQPFPGEIHADYRSARTAHGRSHLAQTTARVQDTKPPAVAHCHSHRVEFREPLQPDLIVMAVALVANFHLLLLHLGQAVLIQEPRDAGLNSEPGIAPGAPKRALLNNS